LERQLLQTGQSMFPELRARKCTSAICDTESAWVFEALRSAVLRKELSDLSPPGRFKFFNGF
jgi:hypothetical protein